MRRRAMLALAGLIYLVLMSIVFSCSKCYNCKTATPVKDQNGNIIRYDTVTDEVCTADQSEIKSREENGAVCTAA